MRLYYYSRSSLLLLLFLANCTNPSQVSINGDSSLLNNEVPLIITSLSSNAFNNVKGTISFEDFSDAHAHTIRIPANTLTDVVLILNKRNRPIMATRLFGGNRLIANHTNTALTLISLYLFPFSDVPVHQLLSDIEENERFETLTKRIATITESNISFLDDALTKSMVTQILEDICEAYSTNHADAYNEPVYSVTLRATEQAQVRNQTKVPFNGTVKHVVSEDTPVNSIIHGIPLDSYLLPAKTNHTEQFHVKDGAYEVKFANTLFSNSLKNQKMARDIIYKLHTVFGIQSNYDTKSLDALIDEYMSYITSVEKLSKAGAIIHTRSQIAHNSDPFAQYIESTFQMASAQKKNFRIFIEFYFEMLNGQNERTVMFSDDAFYEQWDALNNSPAPGFMCIENGNQTDCSVKISPISFRMPETGCFPHEHKITFDSNFYAPFGLDNRSKLRVDWEFLPEGNAGFWLIDIEDARTKIHGRVETSGCFDFWESTGGYATPICN